MDELSKDEAFETLLSRVELLVDNLFIDEPFIEDLSKYAGLEELLSGVEFLLDNLSTDGIFLFMATLFWEELFEMDFL